ncbi:C39 family peptidase [Sphingomonas sp. KR1UV-12]|uniref:C39 family peptidase n=1 Tax=Sphingomonas aurea TaxID=3063994 RepID=A0ABT9ELJ1_9SPHN|nr:C39 family peptidase [Sphingomonas sp. KR1UV-12]MDP1027658.1 C39 family peptidase [Sphingomonas sp. KR1UV-12]
MVRPIRIVTATLLPLALLVGGCAAKINGGDPRIATASTGTSEYAVPVASMLARKFNTVVRQQYDFSCGSAALATLLHYHYGLPRSETEVFTGMWREGDQAQIRRVGFSLLDMKRYLAENRLRADGYKVTLAAIEQRKLPGIALITTRGYRHFVVVKGIAGDNVLLGDPSLGLQTVSRAKFQAMWNGIYFVLNSATEVGTQNFNAVRQWQALARAPIGSPFLDPLSQQALTLSAPFYRDF